MQPIRQQPHTPTKVAEPLAADLVAQGSDQVLLETSGVQGQSDLASARTNGLSSPVGFGPILEDRFKIAEYVADISPDYVDQEFIGEFFRGSKAVLKRLPIGEIREGNLDHNLPNKRKENRYSKMDPATMPPILIDEDGEVWDGNHRFRVAKSLGLDSVWCYQVEDE